MGAWTEGLHTAVQCFWRAALRLLTVNLPDYNARERWILGQEKQRLDARATTSIWM